MLTNVALGLILIDILTNIAHVLCILAVGGCVMLLGSFINWDCNGKFEGVPFWGKFQRGLLTAIIAFALVTSLIPSRQTLIIALGLHTTNVVATEVLNSELGKKATKALETKLDEILSENGESRNE